MKSFKLLAICALLALLLAPVAVYAQEQAAPEHGVIEFGFRGVTGDVYGRTQPGTIPFSNGFSPNLLNSPLNVYSDYRNAFYIPKIDVRVDSLFGSPNYLRFQSASNGLGFENGASLSRDQSILISLGQYGHYKAQFRFDETPHVFTGTTRTLFTSGGPGVWNVNPALQSALFNALCVPNASKSSCTIASGTAGVNIIANTINNAVAGTLVPGVSGLQPFDQQETRKTIGGLLSWNLNPNVNVSALFSRENQVGTRPIGFVMGNGSGAYAAEAPEAIDYNTTNVQFNSEFGQKHWSALLGYQGNFFSNNNPSMVVMNPFSTVYNNTTMGPATGRMDLYPDNHYQQFVGQGAVDLGKHIHLMASVTPGAMIQDANFQPLTTNTFLSQTPPTTGPYPAFLPRTNLDGKVNTLAMNYTAVFSPRKDVKFEAKYQYYDYDNQTPEMLLRPVVGDTSYLVGSSFHGSTAGCFDPTNPTNSVLSITNPTAGNPNTQYTYYCPAEQTAFTNKLLDLGGTWFFTKKNSVKFGYQRGWMDRTNREVAESIEDSFYGALDMHLRKTLTLRVSGRHQNRVPQEYEVDTGNWYSRMPDQSTRVRNRGDVSLNWDATQKLNIAPFFGTVQDNFNQRGGVNSSVPLGDATLSPLLPGATLKPNPIYGPYYAYGLLNSIGRGYGVDVNYALTPKVMLFAEYAREKNTGVFIEGNALNPTLPCTSTSIPVTLRDANGVLYNGNPTAAFPFGTAPKNCDPINDLFNATKDVVNSYYGGVDVTASKKLDVSLYYSLSAGQSFQFSDGVNCQVGSNGPNPACGQNFANWKLDYLTSVTNGVPYTYYAYGVPGAGGFGFPQTVSRIHEVGAIVRFKLTQNLVPKFQYIFRQNDLNDWQTSIVNPYGYAGGGFSFANTSTDPVGTTSLQKMLFLGADNPSYKAHIFSATLEYHF